MGIIDKARVMVVILNRLKLDPKWIERVLVRLKWLRAKSTLEVNENINGPTISMKGKQKGSKI